MWSTHFVLAEVFRAGFTAKSDLAVKDLHQVDGFQCLLDVLWCERGVCACTSIIDCVRTIGSSLFAGVKLSSNHIDEFLGCTPRSDVPAM